MPTKISTLITRARERLLAPKTATASVKADRFWTDEELLDHANSGIRSVWREVIMLHEEHFMDVDDSGNCVMPANGTKLVGVPKDTFRVILIEPLDITASGASRGLKFKPRKYKSPEFTEARARNSLDPNTGGTVFYALAHQGAPVITPTVFVAPILTTALALRFARVPVLPALTAKSFNPIPGESDLCIEAWIVAYARSKERDDRTPDPNWLAVHTTEKKGLLIASSERQEQAATVLKGPFDDEQAEW